MLLWLVCTYLSLVTASVEDARLDDNGPFKVFRVVPTTEVQLQKMITMFETAKGDDADFWHAPSVVNTTVDVMVSPSFTEKFSNFLKEHGYPYQIAIEDLKKNVHWPL
ncbi:carboxypeptidase activation peptide [Ancylostoma caninum]|uniref:Zinc carboxypeptidase A 1 n=1 Tax=Ancylostoma caninum TaxID=29170 RepID=A0A368HCU8_ANCCA|nr:carboxypeptidase activation peptide [Ancylostoma caninum]